MLFRNLVALCLLSCMSLSCSPETSPKNVEQFCPCHSDNEETVLKLVHIDALDAKRLCDEIVASCDEFSSVNVEVQTHTNSLILTGRAREVHLLEWNLRYKALPACRHKIYCPSLAVGYYYSPAPVAFRDNEYTVSELKLFYIDAQDAKSVRDIIIASCDKSSSINVEVQTHTNSLVLTGLAYTVYRIEEFIIKYVDLPRYIDTPRQDCP